MRDPARIYKFCNRFAELWAGSVDDWRFGQLISNFFGWIYETKKRDIFFIEEDEMLELLEEYCKQNGVRNY